MSVINFVIGMLDMLTFDNNNYSTRADVNVLSFGNAINFTTGELAG